jgi:signal transduction histidine kinase
MLAPPHQKPKAPVRFIILRNEHYSAIAGSAISERGNFELSVANAGEPIPAAALEHLFHPFYRGAAQYNREGLGLGLYIANEIARAHGGTLGVQSTREEISFTFRMPSTQSVCHSAASGSARVPFVIRQTPSCDERPRNF